jgi:hypothetical protein
MSPPRTQADDCTNFPDCSSDCDACFAALPHPASDPQVQAEDALAEALRCMREASGEMPSDDDTSEDVYAIVARLKQQGFAITRVEPSK